MSTQAEIFGEVSRLLQEGKVQEADDLAKKAAADAQVAEKKVPASPAPPPPPREPSVITHDLLAGIVNHMGNPPRLHVLISELEASAKKS